MRFHHAVAVAAAIMTAGVTLSTLGAQATSAAAPVSAQGDSLPPGLTVPAGFVIDEHNSKRYDFFHVQIGYVKGGAMQHIDPEGKSWSLMWKLATPNKTGNETDAAMRAALSGSGWELLTTSGLLIAHRVTGGHEIWFSGAAFAGDYPYLKSFPGAHLVRTVTEPGRTFNAAAPGQPDQRAASVRDWLVGHGVAADRLTPKGYGDSQPVADNKTAEGRAKNRRVELKKR